MQNKHQKGDLQQLQSMPLEQKELMTGNLIRQWYEHYDGNVYVAFSGGIDSTVLAYIADRIYDDITKVFVNTGLEYPEIQRFVRDVKDGKFSCFNSDVEIIMPEMRFDEVIKNYGYPVGSKRVSSYVETAKRHPDSMRAKWLRGEAPTKFITGGKWTFLLDAPFNVSAKCCEIMKHRPLHAYEKRTEKKAIIGTMASESPNREQSWIQNGCNAFDAKQQISRPLSFWTTQDILHFIKKYNVPYCPVYGDIQIKQNGDTISGQMNVIDMLSDYSETDILETTGCDRTGCMFCMFGCHLEKEPNRFQKMKVTNPKQYAYCMEKLGLREVLQYIGVKYE